MEVWEDEPFERTEIQKVIEDRKVPQVGLVHQGGLVNSRVVSLVSCDFIVIGGNCSRCSL